MNRQHKQPRTTTSGAKTFQVTFWPTTPEIKEVLCGEEKLGTFEITPPISDPEFDFGEAMTKFAQSYNSRLEKYVGDQLIEAVALGSRKGRLGLVAYCIDTPESHAGLRKAIEAVFGHTPRNELAIGVITEGKERLTHH